MNALTHLHTYLSNFVPCCNASNALEIADEFYGLSGTIAEFLSLVKDEIFVSGYATAIDLGKIYSDVQEYLEFWQAQAACHVPAYVERFPMVEYVGIGGYCETVYAQSGDIRLIECTDCGLVKMYRLETPAKRITTKAYYDLESAVTTYVQATMIPA